MAVIPVYSRVMEKKAPLSNQKRNLLVGVMLAVALLVFIDPLQFFSSRPAPSRRSVSDQELEAALPAFASQAVPAKAQVLALAAERQVVFVGLHLLVKEHLDFLGDLLDNLPDAGVRLVGVEFLLAADQADIDRLVTAPTFDEALARNLYFRWQPLCGYQENIDFLQAAWAANQGRAAGTPPLRIIGLNVDQELSAVKKQEDFAKPEVLSKVFAKGIPDAVMAARVREFTAKGEKMLVACQLPSALTAWVELVYSADMAKRGFPGQRRMGNLVHAALGGQSATVILAGPWPSRQSKLGTGYPADGVVDQLIARLANATTLRFPAAWDLAKADVGGTLCSSSDFAGPAVDGADQKTARLPPRLRDLGSVLVVFGPTRELHPVTPLTDFITPDLRAAAVAKLPAVGNPAQVTVAQLNDSIKKVQEDMRTLLDAFK